MADRTAAVLTVSDSVAAGSARDESGPRAAELLAALDFDVVDVLVVSDGVTPVSDALEALAGRVDLVITTGGTGLGPRDLTPEATLAVIDREVPGIAEALRSATFDTVPFGKLSRGVAGLRATCLIVNLPGSTRAVEEGLAVIGDVLAHAVDVAAGRVGRHG